MCTGTLVVLAVEEAGTGTLVGLAVEEAGTGTFAGLAVAEAGTGVDIEAGMGADGLRAGGWAEGRGQSRQGGAWQIVCRDSKRAGALG